MTESASSPVEAGRRLRERLADGWLGLPLPAGPMAFDAEFAQRLSDVRLYIEQHHHDADLAEVGRRLVGGGG